MPQACRPSHERCVPPPPPLSCGRTVHPGACSYNDTHQQELPFLPHNGSQGCTPEARTYNTIISACAKAGQPEAARGVYERMLVDGVQPTGTTYTSLISAYGKAGQVEEAVRIYQVRGGCGVGEWAGQEAFAVLAGEQGLVKEDPVPCRPRAGTSTPTGRGVSADRAPPRLPPYECRRTCLPAAASATSSRTDPSFPLPSAAGAATSRCRCVLAGGRGPRRSVGACRGSLHA